MKPRSLLPLGALVAVVAFPSVAGAASCPAINVTPENPEAFLDFNKNQPEGGALSGDKIKFPGHYYEATEATTVVVKGNKYELSRGAVFKFSCYGESASDKHLKPSLDLLTGDVDVTTANNYPGGVLTHEGLFDPRRDPTMTFKISRTLKKHSITLDDRMHWFANTNRQPRGTTAVAASAKGPIVGVTPYVGAKPGSCRYVHSAKLTSNTGKGTAKYVE